MKKIVSAIITIVCSAILLAGCSESSRTSWNIQHDADNFKVRRRVVALNTRTNEPLFEVEGLISLSTDEDGDLNVTIKTGEDQYKLFYAHLSDDVTYTSIQLDAISTNPYVYEITFFPAKEVIQHGLIDFKTTEN